MGRRGMGVGRGLAAERRHNRWERRPARYGQSELFLGGGHASPGGGRALSTKAPVGG